MEKVVLHATKRTETGKANARLRNDGKLPAIAYGHNLAAEAITLDAKIAAKVYMQAGTSHLIELKVGDDKARNALIHDVQLDGRTGRMLHADFYLVNMAETIKTSVPLHFVGESTAVYQLEGTLIKTIEEIEIECLPGDLPEALEVDISVLDDFEKTITLADLKLPQGVEMLEDETSLVIVSVEPPRTDEEMAELEAEVGEAVPEGVADDEPIVVKEENEGDKDRK